MASIKHNGKSYQIDEYGFLVDYKSWDKDWVDYVRNAEGLLELSDEHYKVMDALRAYYDDHGISPQLKKISSCVGYSLMRVWELFPSGPGKGACRMAGVPRPSCG